MTTRDVAGALGVSASTLRRARKKANIAPRTKAAPRYSDAEVAQLRAQFARNESELLTDLAGLSARISRLEAQNAAQQAQLDALLAWGQNTARIIRALARQMPDHQPGDTPGEFPAIRLDRIGQEELAVQQEQDALTDAFFSLLDKQHPL